ncbi:hypothetical protein [Moritella viscosa]|uniref:hypothetical protein n=1 Tax=Moritella viscosa TaxID=80854 RepID=UPI00091AE27D|nr:hypothetical protein [Moritella viscosa]SHO16043.1 Putative uncharacterized protein [Moritella viscosa]SHO18843.1 Putative uncharacterized protein [Moritella viscosa]
MNIEKHVIQTAKKHREKSEDIFHKFIDMTYQLNLTMTYSVKYKYLESEHFKFRKLLKKAVKENPFSDVLGEAMMDIVSFDKKGLGQCMTPNDISMLLAKIQSRYRKQGEENGLVSSGFGGLGGTYYECCVGTGSLTLAQLGEFMTSEAKEVTVLINDLDERMLKIAIIQIQYNDSVNNPKKEKTINLIAHCENALIEDCNPDKVFHHPEHMLIQEPYVKGYYEHVNQLQREDIFSTLLNRFKDTEQTNNKAA